ncbi:MAG: hypothetical protein M3151_09555 [Actinomycetota bacterium]|nr:hypothetical protein [Actinomycetota bacterium]
MMVEIEHSLARERNEEMRREIQADRLERGLRERPGRNFVGLRAWLRAGTEPTPAETI